MPLCPQISITPVTVTSSNMTVASVIAGGVPATFEQLSEADAAAQQALANAAAAQADATQAISDASAAQADATQAITDATAALAQASSAYTAAVGSLQPSASTIVNASNQITAINGTGITVYTGASATTGARVVLNSVGMAAYNASNQATFSLTASNGAAVFSGNVTGATITGSDLNINGKFIVNGTTGVMTATDAVVTGTITATTGTFTGTVIATTGTFTGTVIATTGTFTGTVTATTGSFTGTIVSTTGSIGGWTIGTTSISKVVGTLTTTFNASNGFISVYDSNTGFLAGGAISVGTPSVTTSISSSGMGIGSDAAIDVRNELGGYSGILRIYTPLGKGIRLVPDAGLGSSTNNVSVEGHLNSIYTLSAGTYSSSSTEQSTGCYFSNSGAVIGRRSNQIPFFAHRFSTTGTSEMIRLIYNGADAGGITTTSGGVPAFRNASDYRLKSDVQDFVGAADLIKGTRLRSFRYNVDPDNTAVGFIAHELAEVLPGLVLGEKDAIDEEGNPAYQSITATDLIPYLTGALKDIILRVEALEGGR